MRSDADMRNAPTEHHSDEARQTRPRAWQRGRLRGSEPGEHMQKGAVGGGREEQWIGSGHADGAVSPSSRHARARSASRSAPDVGDSAHLLSAKTLGAQRLKGPQSRGTSC